jgi:hypothetical protein
MPITPLMIPSARKDELSPTAVSHPDTAIVIAKIAPDIAIRLADLPHISNPIPPQIRMANLAPPTPRLTPHSLFIGRGIHRAPRIIPTPRPLEPEGSAAPIVHPHAAIGIPPVAPHNALRTAGLIHIPHNVPMQIDLAHMSMPII